MAVTAEGIPVRCWTFPGDASDQAIIRTVHDDLAGWKLQPRALGRRRRLRLARQPRLPAARRRPLRAGREAALTLSGGAGRAGPCRSLPARVAGDLAVKEVRLGDGVRAERFVLCYDPEAAARDAAVRKNLLAYLKQRIAGSDAWPQRRRDELVGELRATPALARLLRRTKRRPAAHRCGRRGARGAARRQVAAAHLR